MISLMSLTLAGEGAYEYPPPVIGRGSGQSAELSMRILASDAESEVDSDVVEDGWRCGC